MRAQRRGRIVNIAPAAGLLPDGSSIGYATSKAALIHLTRCLAVALASIRAAIGDLTFGSEVRKASDKTK